MNREGPRPGALFLHASEDRGIVGQEDPVRRGRHARAHDARGGRVDDDLPEADGVPARLVWLQVHLHGKLYRGGTNEGMNDEWRITNEGMNNDDE